MKNNVRTDATPTTFLRFSSVMLSCDVLLLLERPLWLSNDPFLSLHLFETQPQPLVVVENESQRLSERHFLLVDVDEYDELELEYATTTIFEYLCLFYINKCRNTSRVNCP